MIFTWIGLEYLEQASHPCDHPFMGQKRSSLNIFFTQNSYPPAIGGAQTHLHQLASRLAARHKVWVASYWSTNRTDWLLGTTWLAPGGDPYSYEDVPISPISFSHKEKLAMTPWVLSYYALQSVAIEQIAAQVLKKLRDAGRQADLIHHGRVGREPLAFASLALARERNIPFILTPYHHPRWNGFFYRNYHRLYRQADALIVMTQAEASMLEELGVRRERIFVTGTGGFLSQTYDAQSFRQRHALTGPVVLFLGQKYAYKGFEPILEAAPIVWKTHPDVHFVFIGPRTSHSRHVFERCKDPRILELDSIGQFEKTSALAACDIFCLPSTQECFGSVFLEAWMMGKPVIGAQSPAVADVVEDGVDGFLGPQTADYLAARILNLLEDPALGRRMAAAGKDKAAGRFSWGRLTEATEDIYRQVLGSGGGISPLPSADTHPFQSYLT